jgi:LacI family gluconate utilization system Gnt-I transcriptional repressor
MNKSSRLAPASPLKLVRPRRGAGRVTLSDLAAVAGVSAITVSRFFQSPDKLAEATRLRIAELVEQTGYVPNLVAGGLASARGRIVGLVIPNVSGPIYARSITSFSETLAAAGYQLLLATSNFSMEKEEEIIRAFLGWSPAALVLNGPYHTPGTERLLTTAGMPIIETWDFKPDRPHIQIGFAHADVGRQAAEFLAPRGYRRVAFAQTPVEGDLWAGERHRAFAACLQQEYGLPTRLYAFDRMDPVAAGGEAMRALLRDGDIDALFCANDNVALGAIMAGHRAGIRMPQDCAVLGFGDFLFGASLYPSLTTIQPPAAIIGEIAAQRVLALLEGGAASEGSDAQAGAQQRHHQLSCALIERESV